MLANTMSTQPQFLTVDNAEGIIIVPLSILCAPYSNLTVQFTGSGYVLETGEVRWLCCVQPHPDTTPPTIPIIWELEGVISPFECFATSFGRAIFEDVGSEEEVSFWLVARRRGDHVARIYWDQVLPAVQAIARSIHSTAEVDLSEVIHLREDGSVRLQLKWQPPHGHVCPPLPRPSGFADTFARPSIPRCRSITRSEGAWFPHLF